MIVIKNTNKGKCTVLHLERNNCMHQNRFRDDLLERSFVEQGLGVLVDSRLIVSQQCAPVAEKTNDMPGVP